MLVFLTFTFTWTFLGAEPMGRLWKLSSEIDKRQTILTFEANTFDRLDRSNPSDQITIFSWSQLSVSKWSEKLRWSNILKWKVWCFLFIDVHCTLFTDIHSTLHNYSLFDVHCSICTICTLHRCAFKGSASLQSPSPGEMWGGTRWKKRLLIKFAEIYNSQWLMRHINWWKCLN